MKSVLIFCLFVLAGALVLGVLPTHGEAEIYDSVIRLHVVANSDSEYDQALKLRVRDGVLDAASALVEGCDSKEQAERALREGIDDIRQAAQQVLDREASGYTASVCLGREQYPTKSYESVCFPAGSYTSLQVRIGDAEGQNWWCVVFPNLCLSAAGKEETERIMIQAGLTPEQYKLVTESDGKGYRLRFKLVEIIGKILDK